VHGAGSRQASASSSACIAARQADRGSTHALLAVGRTPNTDDLGVREAGIETDERGYIKSTTSAARA